jgi:hypothetical protein
MRGTTKLNVLDPAMLLDFQTDRLQIWRVMQDVAEPNVAAIASGEQNKVYQKEFMRAVAGLESCGAAGTELTSVPPHQPSSCSLHRRRKPTVSLSDWRPRHPPSRLGPSSPSAFAGLRVFCGLTVLAACARRRYLEDVAACLTGSGKPTVSLSDWRPRHPPSRLGPSSPSRNRLGSAKPLAACARRRYLEDVAACLTGSGWCPSQESLHGRTASTSQADRLAQRLAPAPSPFKARSLLSLEKSARKIDASSEAI